MKTTASPTLLVILTTLLLLSHSTNCNGKAILQGTDKAELSIPSKEKEVYEVVEVQPEFPGGMRALMYYLKKNIRYPKKCYKAGIEGRSYINFVVTKEGKIKDVRVTKSSGHKLLDKEAIRVVKKMPRWKPGKLRGEAVNVRYTLPVTFKLSSANSKKNVAASPIIGIWQLCSVTTDSLGKRQINLFPAIKMINEDNTYSSMFIYGKNSVGRVCQKGHFRIVDDKTFHEEIATHMNKRLEGTISVMKFSFIDNEKNIMKIEYKNQNLPGVQTEYWLRFIPLKE